MTAVPARVNVTHPPDVMTVADGIEGRERWSLPAETDLRDAGTAPPPLPTPPRPTPSRTEGERNFRARSARHTDYRPLTGP